MNLFTAAETTANYASAGAAKAKLPVSKMLLLGILAGFLHSAVVLQAGYVLAGVNLYNNGFSGGLIAIVLFPLITAIFRHRKPELTPRSLFDVFEEDKPALMERDLPPEERTPEGKPFPVIQEKQEEQKSDQE